MSKLSKNSEPPRADVQRPSAYARQFRECNQFDQGAKLYSVALWLRKEYVPTHCPG